MTADGRDQPTIGAISCDLVIAQIDAAAIAAALDGAS